MKVADSSLKDRKKMWEKEKLLVMSNFSFPAVFSKHLKYRYIKTRPWFGKGKFFETRFRQSLFLANFLFLYLIHVRQGVNGKKDLSAAMRKSGNA